MSEQAETSPEWGREPVFDFYLVFGSASLHTIADMRNHASNAQFIEATTSQSDKLRFAGVGRDTVGSTEAPIHRFYLIYKVFDMQFSRTDLVREAALAAADLYSEKGVRILDDISFVQSHEKPLVEHLPPGSEDFTLEFKDAYKHAAIARVGVSQEEFDAEVTQLIDDYQM